MCYDAPWWVADESLWKARAFEILCGSIRPRIRLHWNNRGGLLLTEIGGNTTLPHTNSFDINYRPINPGLYYDRHQARKRLSSDMKEVSLVKSTFQNISMVNITARALFVHGQTQDLLQEIPAPWAL